MAGVTDRELADGIAGHVRAARAWRGRFAHGVHLVVHEPAWLRDPGAGGRRGAVRWAGERGRGGLAAIWHVDALDGASRVA